MIRAYAEQFLVRAAFVLLFVAGLASHAEPVSAQPVFGYLEEWTGTSIMGWDGGTFRSNPGTGGVGGTGDGFLMASTGEVYGRLGTYSTTAPYIGDWNAAGIDRIHLWLNDVNVADTLEIHVVIVGESSLWIHTPVFAPPVNAWEEFVVDLRQPDRFMRVTGTDTTLAQTLENVGRILIRHDTPPFMMASDQIEANLGIDRILLTSEAVPVRVSTWGRLKALYRGGR